MWHNEECGCEFIECILDSGASESVCPRSMAPDWPIEDSPGLRMGLHYLSASGGRIPNLGQQRIPIQLSTGVKTHALFQVAEVSRPLISVARLSEMGNAVIFGASGGVIRNMTTGADTPFVRKEGVYVFTLRIPPAEMVSPTFVRQP